MKKETFVNIIAKKAAKETEIPSGLQERTEYERMIPTYANEWARITREQQAIVAQLAIDKDEKYRSVA